MAADCLGMDGPFGFLNGSKLQPMKIHFYANTGKPQAQAARVALASRAVGLGLQIAEDEPGDVVVALGGDGTLLKAVHEYPQTPVLGLNLGGLGYLSSVEERDFPHALEMLARGRFHVSERTMMTVRKRGEESVSRTALNDVVIVREMSGHAAVLDLTVDGRMAARYMADGLVLATPTGSTAYSLAAGGPVLMPDSGSFVVTPMNPHALGIRPMVVGDSAVFTVTSRPRANGRVERIGVYADGENSFGLDAGESAEIVRSPHGALMLELDGYEPYEVMARKLGWSGSSASI